MENKYALLARGLAVLLCLSGIFLTVSLGLRSFDVVILEINTIIRVMKTIGAFLFEGFSWPAYFIPFYVFACVYLLIASPFRKKWLWLLIFSLIPFFTISLLLKVILSGYVLPTITADIIILLFGKIPGTIILSLIFIWEMLILWRLFTELDVETNTAIRPPAETSIRQMIGAVEAPRVDASGEYCVVEEVEDIVVSEFSIQNCDEDSECHGEAKPPMAVLPVSKPPAAKPPMAVLPAAVPPEDKLSGAKLPVKPDVDGPLGAQNYSVPVDGILQKYPDGEYWVIDLETKKSAETLMNTLEEFKIKAEVTGIRKGPVITMFEILPAPGVKISRIVNLADNIALRLAASRVRIVAPIPGKHAVGIEVPNHKRAIVSFKEMIAIPLFHQAKYEIPVALGKDISGEAQYIDLVQTPHILIAGATGSGKSVCVNSIICSILYRRAPEEVKLLLIDPKIVELKFYNDIPHLLTPVVTNPKRAFQALRYCIYEMERRYTLLDALGVRDVRSYNKKVNTEKTTAEKMPYIVIIIDEFADLMVTTGKEMEAILARLAAMSRAIGIHLVLATQRPSIDVITGLIKANIPSRIAFMVASKFDSRIIIDSVGAEKLLGRGDMLFSSSWDPVPIRIQGAYLSEEEVETVTDHLKTLGAPEYIDEEIFIDDYDEEESFQMDANDPLMDEALNIIISAGKASASYLQRKLKIGYNRAARLIEEMEVRGIVGPANGSKPRDIIHIPD